MLLYLVVSTMSALASPSAPKAATDPVQSVSQLNQELESQVTPEAKNGSDSFQEDLPLNVDEKKTADLGRIPPAPAENKTE
jgi:hypothetical protein